MHVRSQKLIQRHQHDVDDERPEDDIRPSLQIERRVNDGRQALLRDRAKDPPPHEAHRQHEEADGADEEQDPNDQEVNARQQNQGDCQRPAQEAECHLPHRSRMHQRMVPEESQRRPDEAGRRRVRYLDLVRSNRVEQLLGPPRLAALQVRAEPTPVAPSRLDVLAADLGAVGPAILVVVPLPDLHVGEHDHHGQAKEDHASDARERGQRALPQQPTDVPRRPAVRVLLLAEPARRQDLPQDEDQEIRCQNDTERTDQRIHVVGLEQHQPRGDILGAERDPRRRAEEDVRNFCKRYEVHEGEGDGEGHERGEKHRDKDRYVEDTAAHARTLRVLLTPGNGRELADEVADVRLHAADRLGDPVEVPRVQRLALLRRAYLEAMREEPRGDVAAPRDGAEILHVLQLPGHGQAPQNTGLEGRGAHTTTGEGDRERNAGGRVVRSGQPPGLDGQRFLAEDVLEAELELAPRLVDALALLGSGRLAAFGRGAGVVAGTRVDGPAIRVVIAMHPGVAAARRHQCATVVATRRAARHNA
mmetsp:Transcript_47654/g.137163  ORF Transcript_47654/g.137163 Transcript_47654/m.137163 type:complete len:532 (+) Transcript_47654:1582-3177(+)